MFVQTVYLFLTYSCNRCMLNFRDAGIELEHLCTAALNSYEKKIIYDFGNYFCFQNEELSP